MLSIIFDFSKRSTLLNVENVSNACRKPSEIRRRQNRGRKHKNWSSYYRNFLFSGGVLYTEKNVSRSKYQCVQLSRFTRFSVTTEERSRINRFYRVNKFPFSQRRDACAAQREHDASSGDLYLCTSKRDEFLPFSARAALGLSMCYVRVITINAQYCCYTAAVIVGARLEFEDPITATSLTILIIVRRGRYNNSN